MSGVTKYLFGLAGSLFGGGQPKGPSAAEQAAQLAAQQAQQRALHESEEAAAVNAANQSTSTRQARAAGRRVLAFNGVDSGLQPSSPGLAGTLGG